MSAPYYSDDAVTLYNADALDTLGSMDAVDLVLTDPPYNLGIHYGAATDDARPDYAEWCAEWFALCRDLAPLVAISPGIANVGLWHRIAGDPAWMIAWHKPAAMGRCPMGFNNWEPVMLWGALPNNAVDVIVAPVIPDAQLGKRHPCPKPLAWAAKLLALLAEPGAMILDPFAGSGTTLRAAKDRGLTAVGIEVETAYCDLAVERLAQEVLCLMVTA